MFISPDERNSSSQVNKRQGKIAGFGHPQDESISFEEETQFLPEPVTWISHNYPLSPCVLSVSGRTEGFFARGVVRPPRILGWGQSQPPRHPSLSSAVAPKPSGAVLLRTKAQQPPSKVNDFKAGQKTRISFCEAFGFIPQGLNCLLFCFCAKMKAFGRKKHAADKRINQGLRHSLGRREPLHQIFDLFQELGFC